jgi:hypothetical protein
MQYIIDLVGIDGVGLGFAYFKFVYDVLQEEEKTAHPRKHS